MGLTSTHAYAQVEVEEEILARQNSTSINNFRHHSMPPFHNTTWRGRYLGHRSCLIIVHFSKVSTYLQSFLIL